MFLLRHFGSSGARTCYSQLIKNKNVTEHWKHMRPYSMGADKGGIRDLLNNSMGTSDEQPQEMAVETTKKLRKPRHPPKPPSSEPGVDLSDQSVLLFPGQGSQFVGMGAKVMDTPSVKELYEEASHILGYDLGKMCLEGPKEMLNQTNHCQAATVVSSLAAVEHLYHEKPSAVENCMAVAGFSVGEITAAIFTGAMSFSEGIKLVGVRGEAMQAASEIVDSGLMVVFIGAGNDLGFGMNVAKEWCVRNHNIQDPVCQIANHLYCGAKVVGGHEKCLQFLETNKSDFKIKGTRRLRVSGAFHTPLMEPALDAFKAAVNNTKMSDPRVPIYSNLDNRVLRTAAQIKRNLPEQIVKAVKWESSMTALFTADPNDLLPSVYECGPGKTLSTMLSKINGKAAKGCTYISV